MLIKISLSTAVSLYLLISVIGMLVLWFLWENLQKPRRYADEEKRFIWECEICTFIYIDSIHEEISVCPRCGSYNKSRFTASPGQKKKKAEVIG